VSKKTVQETENSPIGGGGQKVIVTGGTGYIGSHTIVDLLENNFEVVCIDSLARSTKYPLDAIKEITGKRIKFYQVDLCNKTDTFDVLEQHKDAVGVIHFAAYKTVPESVADPILYYNNNIISLNNLLEGIRLFKIPNFVFSSSCSVYGNAKDLPVTEDTPFQNAESAYAHTKQIGEQIIQHFSKVNTTKSILLRYFNPVGAHPSGILGEMLLNKPDNLVPYITQTAAGKLAQLTVFGGDYDTPDGSCIRDYIHVCDIAHAHTLALQYLLENRNETNCEIFNLGTGKGVSVLEAIRAFERVTGQKLNYKIGARRAGDVEKIYANNEKAASALHWICRYSIEDAMLSAWNWELKMRELEAEN
jgi:UDP-glucose 4-epimerase